MFGFRESFGSHLDINSRLVHHGRWFGGHVHARDASSHRALPDLGKQRNQLIRLSAVENAFGALRVQVGER